NHLSRQFGLSAKGTVFCLTVFARVIAPAKGDADSARRNQQGLNETMACFAGVFVLVIPPPFPRTALTVACAKSILRLTSLLTAQRLIHHKEKPLRRPAFHLQQLGTQHGSRRQATQQSPSHEAAHLGPVSWFGANRRGRPCRSHAAKVHHESH